MISTLTDSYTIVAEDIEEREELSLGVITKHTPWYRLALELSSI